MQLLKMAMRHSRRTKWRKKSQPTRELESCTATIDVVGPSETTVSSSGLDSGPLDPITPSRSDNMVLGKDITLPRPIVGCVIYSEIIHTGNVG